MSRYLARNAVSTTHRRRSGAKPTDATCRLGGRTPCSRMGARIGAHSHQPWPLGNALQTRPAREHQRGHNDHVTQCAVSARLCGAHRVVVGEHEQRRGLDAGRRRHRRFRRNSLLSVRRVTPYSQPNASSPSGTSSKRRHATRKVSAAQSAAVSASVRRRQYAYASR
jgi:hypothetical protein